MIKLKLDIQMFGGRGASSSISKTSSRTYDGTVNLASYGKADAYKANNIKKGDILLYNYGYTSKVLDVKSSPSGKSVTITTQSSIDGEKYMRTYRNDRLLSVTDTEAKSEKEARIKSIRGRMR